MTKNKTIKIISYIALLLAVIAVFGLIALFTGGFTTDFKTFYVTVDGKDVMSSNGGYLVTQSEPMTVDVKYTFAFANDENKGYSVKVVPNKTVGKDFYYTAGGETHSFYEETELTNAFEITQGETSFTIKPKGSILTEKQDYSTKQHKMQKTIENSFFAEKFGRNDFKEITQGELRKGNTLAYLLKYIQKTGERIVYSRNIPEYIYKEIDEKDIASEMQDFVLKYVLFDDVIDWEKDVAHITYEQMDIFELMRKTAPKEKKQRRKTAQKQGGLAVSPVSPLRFCRA